MVKNLASLYIALCILALTACSPQTGSIPGANNTQTPIETVAPTPAQGNALGNTKWTLMSFGKPGSDSPVISGSNITLEFGADGQATGSGGCNSYGGQYQVVQDTISFKEIIHTEMACVDENMMKQENQYFKSLSTANKFELTGDRLVISYDNGQSTLNFIKGTASGTPSGTPASTTPASPEATSTAPATTPPQETQAANPGDASGQANPYLDDRSTPTGLIQSYFNAINRKEYLRAYSYWRNPADTLGTFDKFQQGYENTDSVEVSIGQVGGDAGAGQIYYSIPVVLKAQTTGGGTQTFAGCYQFHLGSPSIQAVPPFQPLAIQSADIQQVANDVDTAQLLNQNCSS